MPPINLEHWYQDIMAAGEPDSCPPPLPAKSFSTRRHGQVNLCLLLYTLLVAAFKCVNPVSFQRALTTGQMICLEPLNSDDSHEQLYYPYFYDYEAL